MTDPEEIIEEVDPTETLKSAVKLLDRVTVYTSNPVEQNAINLATRHIESAIQGLNPYTGKERRKQHVTAEQRITS